LAGSGYFSGSFLYGTTSGFSSIGIGPVIAQAVEALIQMPLTVTLMLNLDVMTMLEGIA